ncbi:PEP/pyruvate-binding domain-containing protein [Candidatus Woesearchaeota archaeon]|nr:PEP/pyruvate-binding domain-containing protein [Candidatus Woesearchaeota archaeon]
MFLPIKKALEEDASRVGLKAKLFAKLEEQLTLPFSLVLSSEVFDEFLKHNNLQEQITKLDKFADTPEKLVSGFTELATLFKQSSFPPKIITELKECFELAVLDTTDLQPTDKNEQQSAILILRRSTNYADTDITCPGTIFTKESFTDFLDAVKSCILSAFTPSSVVARRAEKISSFSVAVIVSRMPNLQTCFESSLSYHKNNIIVKSYLGFPDKSNIVPKDSFTLSVDFLRIVDAKVIEQNIVAVFDKVSNQILHRKYASAGSAQTVPDQTILEIGRLTKKINAITDEQGLTAEFIAGETGTITCLDVVSAVNRVEDKNKQLQQQESNEEQVVSEELPLLVEQESGEEELARAIITFLKKNRFSQFGPTIDIVVRSLENETTTETIKQGITTIKEVLDEKK